MRKSSNLTCISVTAISETALNKLQKGGIPVCNCRKRGAKFIFYVKNEYRKKVFAIFAHPCYNITVERESPLMRAVRLLTARAGLFVGAAIFIAACVLSDAFIFKIEVSGSGSYLKPDVVEIVRSHGMTEVSVYSDKNRDSAVARILALPDITFCSISKSGGILNVDVHANSDSTHRAETGGLASDVCGKVKNIVALCGTPLVAGGDEVAPSTPLIGAYSLVNGQKVPCMAVGYADIECSAQTVYFADCESAENTRLALASLKNFSEEIIFYDFVTKSSNGGVNYIIDFTYLHTLSINLD